MDAPGPSSTPTTAGPATGPGPVGLPTEEVRHIANEVAAILRENSTPSANPLASSSQSANANPGN